MIKVSGNRGQAHRRDGRNLAEEVIESNTDFDGQERAPMRISEARITLGVVKAREGDLEGAVDQGMRALEGGRKSLPSLLMVSRDLTRVLYGRSQGRSVASSGVDRRRGRARLLHN